MSELTINQEVKAPAERVWAVLTDLEGTERTLRAVRKIERLDGGSSFGVGTRWRETRVMFGREATEEMAVTAIEPGRSYVVEADSRGTHYRSVMGVEALGDSRSRVYMTFAAESSGLLGKIMAATIGRLFVGSIRKALRQDLEDIGRTAEGSGVIAPATGS
jgi:hypothetical protein